MKRPSDPFDTRFVDANLIKDDAMTTTISHEVLPARVQRTKMPNFWALLIYFYYSFVFFFICQ